MKAPRSISFVKETREQGSGGALFVNLEVNLFMEDEPEKFLAEKQRVAKLSVALVAEKKHGGRWVWQVVRCGAPLRAATGSPSR